jgi:hypothetical protein
MQGSSLFVAGAGSLQAAVDAIIAASSCINPKETIMTITTLLRVYRVHGFTLHPRGSWRITASSPRVL